MKQLGICVKCGVETIVNYYHSKGYLPPYNNYTEKYCLPCDRKAHHKARNEGKCKLSSKETKRLSRNSCEIRSKNYVFLFKDLLLPSIRLVEEIDIRTNNNIVVSSYFDNVKGSLSNALPIVQEGEKQWDMKA